MEPNEKEVRIDGGEMAAYLAETGDLKSASQNPLKENWAKLSANLEADRQRKEARQSLCNAFSGRPMSHKPKEPPARPPGTLQEAMAQRSGKPTTTKKKHAARSLTEAMQRRFGATAHVKRVAK